MTKRIILTAFVLLLLFSPASAHSGDTDANGGHYNHSTGEYHYHHGYSEHQHPNGICPYETPSSSFDTSRVPNSTKNSGSIYSLVNSREYKQGYGSGYSSGMITGFSNGYKKGQSNGRKEGLSEGYENGYSEGENNGYANAEEKYKQQINCLGAACIIVLIPVILCFSRCHSKLKSMHRLESENQRLQENNNLLKNQIAQLENFSEYQSHKPIEAEQETFDVKEQLEDALEEIDRYKSKSASPQPPANAKPLPVSVNSSTKITTFGNWNPEVHDSQKQFRKLQRAEMEPIELMERREGNSFIKGASGGTYTTTLNSCTCPDFKKNEHGRAPCKHIYFLALHSGIPVHEIFEDYMKP